jgi:hypothetical protein
MAMASLRWCNRPSSSSRKLPRHAEAGVGVRHVVFEGKAQTLFAHGHQRAAVQAVAVPGFVFHRAVAGEIFCAGAVIHFGHAVPLRRQRQHHCHVPGFGGDLQGQGHFIERQAHWRAVGQHAAEALQRQFAERQVLLVQFKTAEAPAIGPQGTDPGFKVCLQKTVVLLQVLWLQQHAFRPDDFTVPGHVRFSLE